MYCIIQGFSYMLTHKRGFPYNIMYEGWFLTIAIIVWVSSISNTSNAILAKTDLICIYKANQPNVYFLLGKVIEGGDVEAYLIEKSMDYPRDPKTGQLTAAIHPQLQVLKITFISKQT